MHPLETRNLIPPDGVIVKSLEEYKAMGGLQALEKARKMDRQAVIDEVKNAGLRGRGGAGFPTAIKWDGVSKAPDLKKYIVCNFSEGEPGTYKDRYLMTRNPYYLFEGLLIGAYAIDATQAIICTKEKYANIAEILKRVLKEYEDAKLLQEGYIRLVFGPDEYLLGEEKAMLEVIDGRGAMPRFFPPFMVGVGVGPTETNPTVVNNVESLSHIPNIIRNGADWFKSLGNEDTPGTIIMTLSGDIKNPGMYELEPGLTVRQLLYDIGGGPLREDQPIKAVFSGVSNRVMTPDQFDLPLEFGALRANGVGLGSAGFMVYDQSRWMVNIAHMFSQFLAVSSCGQCIPCNSGTRLITERLAKIKDGHGTQEDIDVILDITGRCTQQTRCFLPTQEQIVMRSLIQKFPEEFKNHPTGASCYKNEDLLILKIKDYDPQAGKFVIEPNPKEFRPENALFS